MTFNAIDETSRVVGSRWGGVTGYWLNEAGTKTASKPTFRQVELKLWKVAALCVATDELLEDAGALAAWLQQTVPLELKFKVEDAIVNGDGVGKPLGIMNSGALRTISSRVDAAEIDAVDIGNMWAARAPEYNDYVWLVNPRAFPQLLNLSIGNQPVFLGAGGMSGLPYNQLLGRPMFETEYNAALGTVGDIILMSPSAYPMIEKSGGVQSASSIHVYFTTDETAFRFVYRVGGAPSWYTTRTEKDATTTSPFVVLSAST
jgi:HK97 family phage major capsid protein